MHKLNRGNNEKALIHMILSEKPSLSLYYVTFAFLSRDLGLLIGIVTGDAGCNVNSNVKRMSAGFFWHSNGSCRFSAVAQAQLTGAPHVQRTDSSGYDGAASSVMIHEPLETNSSPSPNPRITSGPPSSSTSSSPPPTRGATSVSSTQMKRNGNNGGANKQELKRLKSAGSLLPLQLARTPSVLSSSCKKDRKNASAGSRFTIYKANKASKKKREKSSAKKERKATKTLAIVLGKLLACRCIDKWHGSLCLVSIIDEQVELEARRSEKKRRCWRWIAYIWESEHGWADRRVI